MATHVSTRPPTRDAFAVLIVFAGFFAHFGLAEIPV